MGLPSTTLTSPSSSLVGRPIHRLVIDVVVAGQTEQHLTHWAPGHGDQNPTLHRLDERHGLVDRLRPSFNAPRLLPANLALLQVRKLPQMMHRVQVSDLHEPCTDPFHHLAARLEAAAPVRFPLEQIARVEGV